MFGRTSDVSNESEAVSPARLLAVVGDSIGSSSLSAANMLSRFSSMPGSESGMMVSGFDVLRRRTKDCELTGGCIEGMMTWEGRIPVVSTVRRVEGSELWLLVVSAIAFCLAAWWAVSRAASSSSCRGTGVKSWYKEEIQICDDTIGDNKNQRWCTVVSKK